MGGVLASNCRAGEDGKGLVVTTSHDLLVGEGEKVVHSLRRRSLEVSNPIQLYFSAGASSSRREAFPLLWANSLRTFIC